MLFRFYLKFWLMFILLLLPEVTLATAAAAELGKQEVKLVITEYPGAELQLEARDVPLKKVLESISHKTGMHINYSVLPDGLITATCVGSTVQKIFECLLAGKADFVFRYGRKLEKTAVQEQPVEAWILGAKFGAEQTNTVVCSSDSTQEQKASEPDLTDELIKMAGSPNAAERAEAIGRLLAEGRKDDLTVKKILEAALSDQDATVRTRAVSSLVHREGEGASAVLHEALHDSDVSVRLTAVDNAGSDIALLQEALTDSDATVRRLAGIRLEPLLKAENTQ